MAIIKPYHPPWEIRGDVREYRACMHMRDAGRIQINAVAFREGDLWVAQGIEYDIAAHSGTMGGLAHAFTRAVLENIAITEHLGRAPLAGVKPAPQRFHEMFAQAAMEVRSIREPDETLAPAGALPNVNLRLADAA